MNLVLRRRANYFQSIFSSQIYSFDISFVYLVRIFLIVEFL